jgi:type I restriction enzyme S subunit
MTDWPVKNLGDLLEVSIGGIWGSEVGEDEVDVFVYRSTELIKDGQLKEELTVRRSISTRQLESRKLEEGDLLLEKSGGGPKTPVGRVGLVKLLAGLSVCSNFMQLMRPKKKEVLPVYLHYFLNHFHIAGHTEDLQNNSTNIRNLKTTEYMEVEVPLPSLEEQARIVAVLDSVTERITELTLCYEQARTHANNMFASALQDSLESNPDWSVKTLGEVCDFVRGVTYDKADARSEMKSDLIPLLRATNITEKGLLREDFVFVPKSGVRVDQKLVSGDALITIASGSASVVGRSVLVEDPGEMTFGAFCGVLRPGPEIVPRYLSHFMSSRSVRTSWSEAAQGTNINNLKRDDILLTECPLPPLDEQKRIVARLDSMKAKTSEMVAAYDAKMIAAKNLRQSILEAAFAGDL